jgi:hypothetical protein
MATKASVDVQDVTFTEKQLGVGLVVSYTNGATAGSEVVTLAQSGESGKALTVQIESGVTTGADIIAAVNASPSASLWVVASEKSGGDEDNAQYAGEVTLAGGAAAVAARVTIDGCMVLTADAAGANGNLINFKMTSGATAGSEVVTVSTNDINVQIADGVSTYAQVKTALDNSVDAAALIAVSNNGVPLSTRVARVTAAPDKVFLAGGVSAAAASGIEQDVTIAADATGTEKNGVVFRYTGGATAGSEVVTVAASLITVQIEDGVSTATQVATALGAAAPFTSVYNVTVSGTGSNAQVVSTKAVTTSGAVGDPLGYAHYDASDTALTTSFVRFAAPFPAQKVEIINDEASGTKTVIVSLNGTNTDVTLDATESVSYSTDTSYFNAVWLKYGVGAPAYRLKWYGI